jgi:hypothetical protein
VPAATHTLGIVLDVANVRAELPAGCAPAAIAAVLDYRRSGGRGKVAHASQRDIAVACRWIAHRGTPFDGVLDALAHYAVPAHVVADLEPRLLAAQLERATPLLLFVETGTTSGAHAVVLAGLIADARGALQAIVCDPLLRSGYRLLVPFDTLRAAATGGIACGP